MNIDIVKRKMINRLPEIEKLYNLDSTDKDVAIFFLELIEKLRLPMSQACRILNAVATVMDAWEEEWNIQKEKEKDLNDPHQNR